MVIALALLALVLPCLILVAWTLERRERNAERAFVHAAMDVERKAWQDERRELLNRIKPETAQYVAPRGVKDTPTVAMDDDQAVWAALQGLSTEEFARQMEETERRMAIAASEGDHGS